MGGHTRMPVILQRKKRSDLWLPELDGGGQGNWMQVGKRYKLPIIR